MAHAVARLLNEREAFLLVSVAEQRRRESSRVVMDRSGPNPTPRVDLVPDEEDLSQLYRSLKAFDTAFRASRIGRVYPLFSEGQPPGNLGWGHHHMGTTAMSKDVAGGVVGVDLRVHGSTNVYALGSSVFPSGGHANPTLTIVALAHRLADHLRSAAREIAT
ncbi:MAG: GMC family oxidoreductase [Gammaproteobacteria bacterium]|nr:GMC family oxidoreductase [Gammaproteobacteria bacterium]